MLIINNYLTVKLTTISGAQKLLTNTSAVYIATGYSHVTFKLLPLLLLLFNITIFCMPGNVQWYVTQTKLYQEGVY